MVPLSGTCLLDIGDLLTLVNMFRLHALAHTFVVTPVQSYLFGIIVGAPMTTVVNALGYYGWSSCYGYLRMLCDSAR